MADDAEKPVSPVYPLDPVVAADPGYCGLAPAETGPWDPYWRDGDCPDHDKGFDKKIDGDKDAPTDLEVTQKFIEGSTGTMLRGVYAVLGYVPYVLIGGIGGAIRYAFLGPKKIATPPAAPLPQKDEDGHSAEDNKSDS